MKPKNRRRISDGSL